MKSKFSLITTVVALFSTVAAQAATPVVQCANLESLKSSAETCDGNQVFADAAQKCMKSYEDLIQARTLAAKAALAATNANVDKAGSSQTHNFAGGSTGYDISQKVLADLIATGLQVKTTIESYLNNIVFPEDFDAPPSVIGPPGDFLEKSQCYAENRDAIEDILDKLDDKLDGFSQDKATSNSLQNTTDSSQVKTGSLGSGKVIGGQGQGSGTPTVNGGKAKNGASTITGVEQDRAKQQKQP